MFRSLPEVNNLKSSSSSSRNRVETSDGAKHEEVGSFRYVGGLAVRGSYEFVGEDGKVHKVNYVADEKGFRPEIID